MFRLHLGDTPHTLTSDDFKELGKLSEGYTGSDIATCVREAIMEPVRIVQNATHFKKVIAPDHDDNTKDKEYWAPCSPGDSEGTEMTWVDIEAGTSLHPPEVTMRHFKKALKTTRPTVSRNDVVKQEEWTKDFGQEA